MLLARRAPLAAAAEWHSSHRLATPRRAGGTAARAAAAPAPAPSAAAIGRAAAAARRRHRTPLPPRSSSLSSPPPQSDALCYSGTVTWDNDASEDCTVLAIDAADYDGLLRVVAWVLYGLQLRIRAAVLRTTPAADDDDDDAADNNSALGRALGRGAAQSPAAFSSSLGGGGYVTDVFWVTDRLGRKLTDKSADGVAERLQEFISTCAPDEDAGARFEAGLTGWECSGGGIHATNGAHPLYTQLTVTADDFSPGLVLEMTSVIAGMGVAVREAVVRSGGLRPTLGGAGGGGGGSNGGGASASAATAGSQQAPPPSPPLGMAPSAAAHVTRALETLPEPPPGKRVLRFWLYDKQQQKNGGGGGGGKLSFSQVQALMYCLGLATGRGNLPTTPPNKTLSGCACSPEPPVTMAGGGAQGGGASTTWSGGDESS
jgi:hypothetical protein